MELIKINDGLVVTKEWYDFISKGKMPRSIPEEVVTSWAKCKEIGIDPYGGKSNIILTSDKIDQRISENMYIINVARPYLEEMYNNIQLDGYIVFLTDEVGNLIFIDGDRKTVEDFKYDINFFVGASWGEEAVGTTAVSLAYTTERAIPFVSQEKYCCQLKKKACCAVPIKDYEGEIIAILGIAANFPNPNPRVFNMLISVSRIIENLLRVEKVNEELDLVNTCYRKVLSSVSDPIVMINNDGIIIELNEKAKEVIGKTNRDIRGSSAQDILGFNPLSFNNSNVKIVNRNIMLRQIIPVFDNSNNLRLGIGFLESNKIKNRKNLSTGCNNVKFRFDDIIGTSSAIEKAKKMGKTAARSEFNVLIQGDSGTGKELFAQAVHNESDRAYGPFIAVNCGAIPENLIESEFFGYEEGSFTGARKEGKPGKFELANGGTIFLDEIGDMPKNLQTSLLRVLQEKEVIRIGGHNPIQIDVRVIAATNKNLTEEVKVGNFREDLFWRINVIPIFVPPLKDREGDVNVLIEYFIDRYSKGQYNKLKFHPDTLDILNNYDWPGNVRELENLVKRLLVFTEGEIILPDYLPDHIKCKSNNTREISSNGSLEDIEKSIIQKVLEENNYNVSETARKLNISRNTIYNKLGVDKINSC